jgi:hypothetical protein
MVPPQLSGSDPWSLQVQVRGMQQPPEGRQTPLPSQAPQSSGAPQPLPPGALPQERPMSSHERGEQQLPPLHTSFPLLQSPQCRMLPQPSLTSPH